MTIKELADELGVSKQAIRKRVNQLDSMLVSITANQPIEISDEGANQIRALILTSSTKNRREVGAKVGDNVGINIDSKVGAQVDALTIKHRLEILELENRNYKDQLKILEKQNEEQGQRIDTLLQLVDQAQQLQAIAEQKINLLEQKQEEPPIKEPKKKWWQFFSDKENT